MYGNFPTVYGHTAVYGYYTAVHGMDTILQSVNPQEKQSRWTGHHN